MIERIVPAGVVVEAVYGDEVWAPETALFPEEAEAVAEATPGRQREFATTRLCARRGMARLGHEPAPLTRSRRGAPGWPPGLVGSLTHCAGYRAAAVARTQDVGALGIDAEPNVPLPEGLLASIATPAERLWVRSLTAQRPEVCWDRLLFSIKESTFKTWYPLTGRELEFREAEVALDLTAGTCQARPLVPAPVIGNLPTDCFRGRWMVRYGLITTAMHVPRTAW
ncbi:4'-phosphopantetheinyl transferase family protein [Streptomyces sp. NBC_01439]|uniref:4'-phosphopantetheinyl transferase family protein n=1 Tax=Streptomyces sp. NBC_01439 TaxID=2903867 RepID=UPI002E2B76F8|nr:4'-phosphopantetheinyl transferase superfamily protein [Streptomyces sp. NBC_01439]